MTIKQTKSARRETERQKKLNKQYSGATLAGQIIHATSRKKYSKTKKSGSRH